ncbi:5390_t:CDS:1 [Dentiscutata heterogama]|uniref:5390_t:CDS:1 n=1 Tax=Dentiscutata heterogama TaxID=1316150 RepID=A0ACA9KQC4_9GLOM|nr:5390_t:CDS:1 [Dentiscutata heterogama]
MDHKSTLKVISLLKILSFLLYFILWIYFEVNEFKFYELKSNSANLILTIAFAFSIIFFCTETISAYIIKGLGGWFIANCWMTLFIYFILPLVYSDIVNVGYFEVGKVLPALIVLLWIIQMLSLTQIIIINIHVKPDYLLICKIIKLLFITIYLIDYIIWVSMEVSIDKTNERYDISYFGVPEAKNSFTNEKYKIYHFSNLIVVSIVGFSNFLFEVVKACTNQNISFIGNLFPILFTFIYFGVAFSNILFLTEITYIMLDGLIWIILICSFVEIVFWLNNIIMKRKL